MNCVARTDAQDALQVQNVAFETSALRQVDATFQLENEVCPIDRAAPEAKP